MNSIHDICKEYDIENYTINSDGSIDVAGDVDLYDKGLTEIPLVFNKVTGYFSFNRIYLKSFFIIGFNYFNKITKSYR